MRELGDVRHFSFPGAAARLDGMKGKLVSVSLLAPICIDALVFPPLSHKRISVRTLHPPTSPSFFFSMLLDDYVSAGIPALSGT